MNDALDEQPEPELSRIYSFAGNPLKAFSIRRRNAFHRLGYRYWQADEGRESFQEKVSAHIMILQMTDAQVDGIRGERATQDFFSKIPTWQEINGVDYDGVNVNEAIKIFNEQWDGLLRAKDVIATVKDDGRPTAPTSGNE